MKTITVSVTETIPANHEAIYAVIADYHVGHQAILPRPAFREMIVIEGGYGAGTRTKIHVRMFGQSVYMEHLIEESIPGYELVERDVSTGGVTTFKLNPLLDNETEVTIHTIQPTSNGLMGFIERLSQPTIMRNLFKTELQNLKTYVRQEMFDLQRVT